MRIFLTFLLFFLLSCEATKDRKYSLKIKGSESLNEAFVDLKKDFESLQDSITLEIEGGGSRTGLRAIALGQADIGLSSFGFNLDSLLGPDHGVEERVVAYDGIVVINHEQNPVTKLTNEQITKIFTGTVSDWSELGGSQGRILPIVRDSNSGTQKFFARYFGIADLSPNVLTAAENREIVDKILGDENGIGFIGMSYFSIGVNDVKIPLGTDDDQMFVEPSSRTVMNGTYPLKRALRIYYDKNITPGMAGFLQYLDTNRARNVIETLGLVAPSKDSYSLANSFALP